MEIYENKSTQPKPWAWSRTKYHYDSHGRQDQQSAGRILTYTAFDLPKTVTLQANSNYGVSTTWTLEYDAFGNRAEKSGPVICKSAHETFTPIPVSASSR